MSSVSEFWQRTFIAHVVNSGPIRAACIADRAIELYVERTELLEHASKKLQKIQTDLQ